MSFQTIMPKIITVLQSVSKIGEVHNYEKYNLQNFPAVTVIPSGNESDYETTSENMRTYGFQISVYYPTEIASTGDNKKEEADRIMRGVVDDIVDEFDKPANRNLGNTIIWIPPTPSSWGYDTIRNLRVAQINIQCKKSIDINNL